MNENREDRPKKRDHVAEKARMTPAQRKEHTRLRINESRVKCGLAPLEFASSSPNAQAMAAQNRARFAQEDAMKKLADAAKSYQEALNKNPKGAHKEAQAFRFAWNIACGYTKEQKLRAVRESDDDLTISALRSCSKAW